MAHESNNIDYRYLGELEDHDIVLDRFMCLLIREFGFGEILDYLWVRACTRAVTRNDDWDTVSKHLQDAFDAIPEDELRLVECNQCGSLNQSEVKIVDTRFNEEKKLVVTFYCPKCRELGKSLIFNSTKTFDFL